MEGTNGPEEYDAKKAFLEYKEAQEGKPIDPRAVAAGKKELEMGAKGDFAVYGDELSKAEKFKRDPEGDLFKTNLTEAELADKIQSLTKAREFFIKFLEKPTIDLAITPKTTLEDLKNKLPDDEDEGVTEVLFDLFRYEFNFNVTLFDLPSEIAETINKDNRVLNHLKHKSS